MLPYFITIEEHYDSQVSAITDPLHSAMPASLQNRLCDLGESRIADLDSGNVKLQVISHIGGPKSVEDCIKANSKFALACKGSRSRFAGWASLPMQAPEAAAAELTRAVKDLGLVGALVDNHTEDGSTYDDVRFWPVLARAVELDVPMYIHPSYPADKWASHYQGNYTDNTAVALSASSWGWHSECGMHILRLFASGVFDQFPKLKIVIGHMGETIPYTFDRIAQSAHCWGLKRDLQTIWQENIWVTTSGLFTLPPLEYLLKVSPLGKVMFSVDYPFSTNGMGMRFLEEIQRARIFSPVQLKAFCHGNAERLLKLDLV